MIPKMFAILIFSATGTGYPSLPRSLNLGFQVQSLNHPVSCAIDSIPSHHLGSLNAWWLESSKIARCEQLGSCKALDAESKKNCQERSGRAQSFHAC